MKKRNRRHVSGECEMLEADYHLCQRRADYRMTRVDDSTQLLCTKHANKIRGQMDKHPESFAPVRFVSLRPAEQLTKY